MSQMTRLHTMIFVVALHMTLWTMGVSSGQEAKLIREVEGVRQYEMSNGLRILLYPNDAATEFTLNMTVHVGSRHEGLQESGMAHLLEHLLARGTERFPDISEELNRRGALRVNGAANRDRTRFYETLPATPDNLEFAISLEADRLIHSRLTAEDFEDEMALIRTEFDRTEALPELVLYNRILENSFSYHRYGKAIFGNRTEVERIGVPELRRFYKKHYRPDNVTLVLTGRFEEGIALRLLAEQFGKIPKPATRLEPTKQIEPIQDGERTVVVRRPGTSKMVGVAYHIPSVAHELFPAVEVCGRLMVAEPSGPLYRLLIEKKLAGRLNTRVWRTHDPGVLFAIVESSSEADLIEIQRRLTGAIERLSRVGFDENAVQLAVLQMLQERERRFANTERMALTLGDWDARGDWRLFFLHRDRLEKVTGRQIKQVAEKYLVPTNRTLGVYLPSSKPTRIVESAPDLKQVLSNYRGRASIQPGEAFLPTPANIEARTTKGRLKDGLRYALLPKKARNEEVSIRLNLRYGNLSSLRGFEAAMELLPRLLMKGTQTKSSSEFDKALAELSTEMEISGDVGELTIQIRTKRKSLVAALSLLREALREPGFDPFEFKVVQRLQLTRLQASLKDPRELAINAMRREMTRQYGLVDIRYVPSMPERIQRLESLELRQLKKLHREFLNGRHGEIAMVGDFDAAKVPRVLESVLGGWKEKQKCERLVRRPLPKPKPRKILIQTPGNQNVVFLSVKSIRLDDAASDLEAALIGNYILGGSSMETRLASRLKNREKTSGAVGSRLRVSERDDDGRFLVFAFSASENAEKIVTAVQDEWNSVVQNGVSNDELERAKQNYVRMQFREWGSEQGLARVLAKNLAAERDMSFYNARNKRISELGKEEVESAIKKYFSNENAVTIKAGDLDR